MTGQYNRNTPHGCPGVPYGGYGAYGSYPAGGYYTQGAQLPYYAYQGPVALPYPPHQPHSAPYQQHRRRGNSGAPRRPPQPPPASDSNRGFARAPGRAGAVNPQTACEVCNMFFRSPKELSEHVDELHVRCEVDGCGYSAPVDLMSLHALKHVKNQNGEYVLDSAEETRKWVTNRRNRHPLNRHRDLSSSEDSTLERLLRDAHRKPRGEAPARSVLYPIISKVRPRPSALLQISDPVRYRNMLRQSSAPYSYRPSVAMGRAICQNFRRTRSCKFGDACQYSHDLQGGGNRDLYVTKRPPTVLHVLKNDIYRAEKLLVSAIKAIVSLDFFDEPVAAVSADDRAPDPCVPPPSS
ncbi:exonuclease 1, putative [Babesia caballi]|uniref:Exonuclease 1, putative n=1 Tax=Babesia caballi TaxID=5871 RepID=A0AAV4LWL6_BABCB|nr:exonuclease 1, putative [Babesia caballi]